MKDFPRLSFKKPKVDRCKTCDLSNIKSKIRASPDSCEAKLKLMLHQKKAGKAFETMKNNAISSTRPGSSILISSWTYRKCSPFQSSQIVICITVGNFPASISGFMLAIREMVLREGMVIYGRGNLDAGETR